MSSLDPIAKYISSTPSWSRSDAPARAAPRWIGSEGHDVRVAVDLSKCFGHARCEDLCPEVFATDPVEGKCVIRDPEVPPGLREKVRLAVRNCPERALEISNGEAETS